MFAHASHLCLTNLMQEQLHIYTPSICQLLNYETSFPVILLLSNQSHYTELYLTKAKHLSS